MSIATAGSMEAPILVSWKMELPRHILRIINVLMEGAVDAATIVPSNMHDARTLRHFAWALPTPMRNTVQNKTSRLKNSPVDLRS